MARFPIRYGFRGIGAATVRHVGNGPYQNITKTVLDVHGLLIDRLQQKTGIAGSIWHAGRAQQQALKIGYRGGDCEQLDLDDAT
jgi:hypothetical protein